MLRRYAGGVSAVQLSVCHSLLKSITMRHRSITTNGASIPKYVCSPQSSTPTMETHLLTDSTSIVLMICTESTNALVVTEATLSISVHPYLQQFYPSYVETASA